MPKLKVLGTCNDSSQRADKMLCYRSVLTLLTMLAEVSTSPAFQQKTHRFEQFHAQKDFILGTAATTFFLVREKKKKRKKRIPPGTAFLPQSVLFPYFKEMNLSVHKGTEKFQGQPRD